MIELSTHVYGDGARRALLLHGLGSNSAGWWRLGPALVGAGFAVTAPDLRGHGESEHPEEYALADYADDVTALGENWDLVIGHSLGGAVAVTILAQTPDFARRLVLLDPAVILPDTETTLQALMVSYEGPLTPERVAADNPSWHLEDARIKAQALQQSSATVTLLTVRHNPDWNLVREVTELDIPTLLIGADPENGALVGEALGTGIASHNDSVTFVSIHNATHSIHRDEFDALIPQILEFAR